MTKDETAVEDTEHDIAENEAEVSNGFERFKEDGPVKSKSKLVYLYVIVNIFILTLIIRVVVITEKRKKAKDDMVLTMEDENVNSSNEHDTPVQENSISGKPNVDDVPSDINCKYNN